MPRRDGSQMVLPGVDMRPICPLCGQPADVLGQWSPSARQACCKTCSLETPYPLHLLPAQEQVRDLEGRGLPVPPDLRRQVVLLGETRARMQTVFHEARVRRRKSGLVNWHQLAARRAMSQARWRNQQQALRICYACGAAIPEGKSISIGGLCPICNGKDALARFIDMAPHLQPDMDDESLLDLYYRHPAIEPLFEAGLMPDLFFRLRYPERFADEHR